MKTIMTRPLVRIIDDDKAICEALVFVLKQEGYDAQAWTNAEDFLREEISNRPGCLLLDIRMPGLSGLELQRVLKARKQKTPIIFISAHGDIDTAVYTMKMGAYDFLQKPLDPERVIKTVANALAKDEIQKKLAVDPDEAVEKYARLTAREKQVAEMTAEGLPNAEIGERLGITERTAEVHRANIYRKLEISDITGLRAVFAAISFEGQNESH